MIRRFGLGSNFVQVAAQCGNYELCEFLLREFPSYREDAVLRRALQAFVSIGSALDLVQSQYRLMMDAMYRLFINENGLEVHISYHKGRSAIEGAGTPASIEDNVLLSEMSVQTIIASQLSPFAQQPWTQRFSAAVNSRSWSTSLFMRLIDTDSPAQLAFQTDNNGKTALHWAAEQCGYRIDSFVSSNIHHGLDFASDVPKYCSPDQESFARLMGYLLQMGANACALNSAGESPLTSMLHAMSEGNSWRLDAVDPGGEQRKMLAVTMEQWGSIIADSGFALKDYVLRETHLQRCLTDKGHRYRWYKGNRFKIEQMDGKKFGIEQIFFAQWFASEHACLG